MKIKQFLIQFLLYACTFIAIMLLWNTLSKSPLDLKGTAFTGLIFGLLIAWSTLKSKQRVDEELSSSETTTV